jgi:hypothetical protein
MCVFVYVYVYLKPYTVFFFIALLHTIKLNDSTAFFIYYTIFITFITFVHIYFLLIYIFFKKRAMCVYTYIVYIYIHMYIYIHIHACVCVYTHTYIINSLTEKKKKTCPSHHVSPEPLYNQTTKPNKPNTQFTLPPTTRHYL